MGEVGMSLSGVLTPSYRIHRANSNRLGKGFGPSPAPSKRPFIARCFVLAIGFAGPVGLTPHHRVRASGAASHGRKKSFGLEELACLISVIEVPFLI
jgi:hypothetical protein